jgi:hypothetical protein
MDGLKRLLVLIFYLFIVNYQLICIFAINFMKA